MSLIGATMGAVKVATPKVIKAVKVTAPKVNTAVTKAGANSPKLAMAGAGMAGASMGSHFANSKHKSMY